MSEPEKYPIPRIQFENYQPFEEKVVRPKLDIPEKYEEGVMVSNEMEKVLLPSFVMLILGRPGSGKTYLLSQLLTRKDYYSKKFDRILYVTPSNIPGIEHKVDVNTCRTLEVGWLYKKIEECSTWCQNMLIVLDDVVSDIPASQRNSLKTLFYDRRHLLPNGCISIIVTTQKYSCAPLWIRVCLSTFISFGLQPNEVKSISLELNTGKDKKTLDQLFSNLRKHHFLLFNLEEAMTYNHDFVRI